jgi:hypothetical protein
MSLSAWSTIRSTPVMARRLVAVCAVALAGCGGDGSGERSGQGCTLIGCGPQVQVHVPDLGVNRRELITVRACVAGRCGRTRQPAAEAIAGSAPVHVRLPADRARVRVTVSVTRSNGQLLAQGETVAPVTSSFPNGKRCGPECRSLELRLGEDRMSLAPE